MSCVKKIDTRMHATSADREVSNVSTMTFVLYAIYRETVLSIWYLDMLSKLGNASSSDLFLVRADHHFAALTSSDFISLNARSGRFSRSKRLDWF